MNFKSPTLTAAILMLACISASGSCDLFELETDADSTKRNVTISCGTINSSYWSVSNDSCGLKTNPVLMTGDSGILYTVPVELEIDGSGNLECDDIILISYFIDSVWYPQDTVRGCDFSSVITKTFSITCYAGQAISVSVSFINDDSNENFQLQDKNLCIGKPVLATPIPVLWSYFEANAFSGFVKLSWETKAEIENDMFTLERSIDGLTYTDIGYVAGAGNSTSPVGYRFDDVKPIQGYAYYRVKQTDLDGDVDYSSVMAVHYQKSLSSDFDLYPNPVQSDQVYINFEDLPKEEFLVALYDPLGRILFSNVVLTGNEDGYATAFDKEIRLAAGVYLVVGSSQSRLYHKRLVIQAQQGSRDVYLHIAVSSK